MTTLTQPQYNKLQRIEGKAYKTAWSLKRVSPADSKVLQDIKMQWASFCTGLGIYNEYNDEAQYIDPNGEKRSYTFHDACC